jgi:hypothetical protein
MGILLLLTIILAGASLIVGVEHRHTYVGLAVFTYSISLLIEEIRKLK